MQRAARRTPLAALLAAVLLTGVSGWGWTRYQWQAARAALAADRFQEARERLTQPLWLWRWSPDVHVLAARAERLSGNLPAAEAHLKQALRLAGGATEGVQLEFLLLRVQTGEIDQVAPLLIEAADNGHPEAPLILSTLSVGYMHNLRYMRAYACLSRWLELEPNSAKAYQYRGWILERMNRRKEAMEDYQKALEIDPELFAVRLAVAEMLFEDRRPHEALPHLERLYRQAPDHALVLARLGMCRYLQGDAAEARRFMEAALPQLPNDPPLHITLSRLDLQEGRAAEAERRLRAVVRNDPSDTEAYYTLFTAVQAQNRPEEAAAILKECEHAKVLLDRTNKLLREVVDSQSARTDDYAELGELLLRINQPQRGLYWLYEALERDPAHQQAHRVLAAYYEQKGDSAKAASHRRWLRPPEAASDRSTATAPP